MADEQLSPITENPWQALRKLTPARIALGRAGGSLPTREVLDFQLAHARARDAVHTAYDVEGLVAELQARALPTLVVQSAATDRSVYLQRPDLGRRLSVAARCDLEAYVAAQPAQPRPDAVLVVADGLSALAVQRHAVAVVERIVAKLQGEGWRLAPVVVAAQSRVALGDEVGEVLQAEQVAILIGERPGLSAADSLGIYLTYAPRPGRADSERNCISNVRPEGLSYDAAAFKLAYLMREARRLKLSGVDLKDDSDLPQALGAGE
jgi:ethanolamine ammonia-lyase small subunit